MVIALEEARPCMLVLTLSVSGSSGYCQDRHLGLMPLWHLALTEECYVSSCNMRGHSSDLSMLGDDGRNVAAALFRFSVMSLVSSCYSAVHYRRAHWKQGQIYVVDNAIE